MKTNKEQQELLDEVYRKYADSHEYFVDGWLHVIPMEHSKETFINKCKTDPEFSEKWGLKIEERELSFEERWDLSEKYGYRKKGGEIPSETETFNGVNEREEFNSMMNDPVMGTNLPTKLITITYNDKTIESYE